MKKNKIFCCTLKITTVIKGIKYFK